MTLTPFWKWLKKHPLLPWVLAFVLLNVLVSQDGETNAASRFATLQAMAQHHTFQIDRYKDWTMDWALAPNGHYYSNKAPGPMFIAFPVAWALSAVNHYVPFDMGAKAIVCLVTQVLPFAVLVLLLGDFLLSLGVSIAGVTLAAIAMLFGNTADVFMNCFFGHGMAAVFVLGMILAMVRRRPGWAGLCFGFALLSDYGAGFLGPPLLLAIAWQHRERLWPALRALVVGGLFPGALWVWYHWTCFGSPFALPMQFTNPSVMGTAAKFSLIGPLHVWYELLLGPHRGILVTQPWLYVVIAGLFIAGKKELRLAGFVALAGLLGLLWMNTGFTNWDGGCTPGPRYLCLIFPAFGFLIGSVYDGLGKSGKALLWATVSMAVTFRMLVYCDLLYVVPSVNLWKYYAGSMFIHFFSKYAVSFFIFWIVIGGAAYWQSRSLRFAEPARLGTN